MTVHSPTAMPRSQLHYTAAGTGHILLLHWAPGTDATLAQTNATAVANQFKTISPTNLVFDGHSYAPAGSNIFNPTAWTNITGTATGTINASFAPGYYSFVGRTVGGCRTRLYLYAMTAIPDANWRVEGAEAAAWQAVITWLNSTSSPLVARDGLGVIWKNYANAGFNAHYQKKSRRNAG